MRYRVERRVLEAQVVREDPTRGALIEGRVRHNGAGRFREVRHRFAEHLGGFIGAPRGVREMRDVGLLGAHADLDANSALSHTGKRDSNQRRICESDHAFCSWMPAA